MGREVNDAERYLWPVREHASTSDGGLRDMLTAELRRVAKALGEPEPPIRFTPEATKAETRDGEILVNLGWLRGLLDRTSRGAVEERAVVRWILAHEMTHTLFGDGYGHITEENHGLELRADFHAGRALASLGDDIDHVLPAMRDVTPHATPTRPDPDDRAKALREGHAQGRREEGKAQT